MDDSPIYKAQQPWSAMQALIDSAPEYAAGLWPPPSTESETTPDNYVSPTGAVRNSEGKVDYSLVPLDLLDGTARVFQYGLKKYSRWNWRRGFPPEEALKSVFRHLKDVQKSIYLEDKNDFHTHLLDLESGEGHAHHLLCSVLILIDSMRLAGYKI